jgi:hypothetical protein
MAEDEKAKLKTTASAGFTAALSRGPGLLLFDYAALFL